MAALTVQGITKAGLDIRSNLTPAEVTGDTVAASGGLLFSVTNGDGSPHTVTVSAPVATTTCGGFGSLPVADIAIVVGATSSTEFVIPGGFAANGLFTITYDAVTSVEVGVFSLDTSG